MIREALLYEKERENRVRCSLCAHRCRIDPGRRGLCGVRENREGTLFSLIFGTVLAENVDPIEKKPFFHFLPGSRSFSIAAAGCNFRCSFCQNHEISQMPREQGRIAGRERTAAEIVAQAVRSGSKSIAYTYTEPTVFLEFILETAGMAKEKGLKNVFVTNGYMTPEALSRMAPCLDAANVDLKSFRDRFYREQCGARLEPVLDTLKRMKHLGVWVEVTTLLIPGLNDGEEELHELAAFVASLGKETPWHVSRFHPQYHMTRTPPTPAAAIQRAAQIGRSAGLKYIYSGNLPGDAGENTNCARCGRLLIGRWGFSIECLELNGSVCPGCGTALEGIFE